MHVTVNINIVFMVTQMQTRRISSDSALHVCHYWHNVKLDANVDVDAICERTFAVILFSSQDYAVCGQNTLT